MRAAALHKVAGFSARSSVQGQFVATVAPASPVLLCLNVGADLLASAVFLSAFVDKDAGEAVGGKFVAVAAGAKDAIVGGSHCASVVATSIVYSAFVNQDASKAI